MPHDNGRRLMAVKVSERFILELFRPLGQAVALRLDPEVIPADATVRAVHYDHDRLGFSVVVESREFPIVPLGAMLPIFNDGRPVEMHVRYVIGDRITEFKPMALAIEEEQHRQAAQNWGLPPIGYLMQIPPELVNGEPDVGSYSGRSAAMKEFEAMISGPPRPPGRLASEVLATGSGSNTPAGRLTAGPLSATMRGMTRPVATPEAADSVTAGLAELVHRYAVGERLTWGAVQKILGIGPDANNVILRRNGKNIGSARLCKDGSGQAELFVNKDALEELTGPLTAAAPERITGAKRAELVAKIRQQAETAIPTNKPEPEGDLQAEFFRKSILAD
jgi:hypothetical protein